jgi:hypothetical protein
LQALVREQSRLHPERKRNPPEDAGPEEVAMMPDAAATVQGILGAANRPIR